ncbi:MAG: hypothetical protein HQL06_00365 [Nitrospirae bacterium]|nr:hypothetical protein [Nitrospirota bacterium]
MKKFVIISFLLLGVLVSAHAYGFDIKGLKPTQPNGVFSSFSTATNGPGIFSNEVELEECIDPTFYRITTSIAYGIDDNRELLATVPFRLKREQNGFEDVSVGLKHRFVEERGLLPSLALLMTVSPPSDGSDVTTNGRYGGGLIASKKIGPFMAHINAFYFSPFDKTLKSEWDMLLGTELSAANNINILAELSIRKSHFSNRFDFMEGRLGYRYRPLKYLYTTLGAGYEFRSRTPELRFLLSITFVYPYKEPEIKRLYEEE